MPTARIFQAARACRRGLAVALLLAWAAMPPALAAGWDGRFEALRFRLSWLFVPAGTAVIQARPLPGAAVEFRVEACTYPAVDLFYKVRDRIRVVARRDDGRLRPRHYRFVQREGGERGDLELRFGAGRGVTVIDHAEGTRTPLEPVAGTLDMVSAFFATRAHPLEPGDVVRLPVIDDTETYVLEVAVLERDVLDTPLGRETPVIRIHPRLRSEGIFKRTAAMHVWLTDDERHIPVRMESAVRLGKIIARLEDIRREPRVLPPGRLACEAAQEESRAP